ncbi:MAG: glycosyltransferase [Deltaproteobacteria bacterium]|nr:glycosyltransferase [Deltaproteobacteria bacterium]
MPGLTRPPIEGQIEAVAILFWLLVALGAVWTALFLHGLAEARRAPRLYPAAPKPGEKLGPVCVLVPARDEEARIGACLRSLLAQDLGEIEIAVIDDRSGDRTAEIVSGLAAGDSRLRLIRLSAEPPPGWIGKCHALAEGMRLVETGAPWTLFVDADTVHHPSSISTAVAEAEARGLDMLSLVPHLQAESFWERLVQPAMAALIALFHKPSRINDPARPEAFANGQYVLIRTAVYRRIGGHAAVAGKVLEDVELARVVKGAGGRIFLAIGRDLLSTRMYSDLGGLVEGWTKNFYMLMRSQLSRVTLAALTALVLSAYPAACGLLALAALAAGYRPLPVEYLVATAGIYALVLGFQVTLRALNRWYPAYALLAPVANAVAVYILLRSAWRHRRGQAVRWKGRLVRDDGEGG